MSSLALAAVSKLNRNTVIAGGVVLFHVAAIWALQTGLLRRAADIVIPVQILSEIVTPPAPKVEPEPASPLPPPKPIKQPIARKAERELPALPRPAPADARPAPNAPVTVPEAQRTAPTNASVAEPRPAAPGAAQASVSGPPAKVELPSSDASYLQNPPLVYPPISKRLGEEGKVIVRVLIGADGVPRKAELKRTSGFDRLDRSALEYVMQCRYLPGKVDGVPQVMWYDAPVSFVLQ